MRPAVLSQLGKIFAGHFSNAFFGLVALLCLTRVLDVGQYGQYSYVLQVLAFFSFLSLPGMGTAVLQSAAQGRDRALVSGMNHRLQFSILGSAAIVCVTAWRWQGLDPAMRGVLLAGAAAFPAYVCLNTYLYFLNGKRDYRRYALFNCVQTGAICAAVVAAAVWTRSFVWTAAAAIAAKIILDAVLYRRTLRIFAVQGAPDDPDAFRVGWHLSMVSVISCFGNNFDKVIIGTWISYEALAVYTVADMIAGQFKILSSVMDSYISPVIVKETAEAARGRLLQRSLLFLGVALGATVLGYAVVSFLIGTFFTYKYAGALPLIGGLLAVNILSSPGAVISTHFRAQRRMIEPYMIKICESLGFLLALAAFVPLWKVWGIIAALGVANVCYSATGILLASDPRPADRFAGSPVGRFILCAVPRRGARQSV